MTVQNVAVTRLTSTDAKGGFQVGSGIEVASDFFAPRTAGNFGIAP